MKKTTALLVLSLSTILLGCSEQKEESQTQVVSETAEPKSQAANPTSNQSQAVQSPSHSADKKMSNTAKGALIGAGAGAITGAAVSKKKGKGAVVGGIIGAGAGAITGKLIDKKKEEGDNN